MKKKVLAFVLTAAMVLGLAACGGNGGNGGGSSSVGGASENKVESEAPAGNEGESKAPEQSAAGGEEASGDTVTLRFASWALGTAEENNLDRQMIAAFEDSHPNIKIEIAEDITGDWNEALNTAAAGGNLPDVSLIAELPTAVANGWALNLNDLIAEDPDWNGIPDSLRESGTYNGKTYGIPSAMHLAGIFMNLDLFEEMNATPLTYGYSWDDFMATVEATHNPSEGKSALKYVNDFVNFLPALWDDSQGWYTYDGNQMHLDSDVFKRAVKETNNLYSYSWPSLSEEQKAKTAGAEAGDYDAWKAGYTAMWYDATYCCEGYARGDVNYAVEFVALPGGKSVIIPDYCFISATTQHPKEAWEFVKFMFWGVEGTNVRMDLDAADDAHSWTAMPITSDAALITRYFDAFPIAGVKEAYEGMSNGTIVEAFKFAPGYSLARWNGTTGITIDDAEATMATIVDKCIAGTLSIDDYASQLNTLANGFIAAEREAIDAKTK